MPGSDLQDIYARWLVTALAGKSVTKVAEEAGIARQTIYRVLQRKPVSSRKLEALSHALGHDLPTLTVGATTEGKAPGSPVGRRSSDVAGTGAGKPAERASLRHQRAIKAEAELVLLKAQAAGLPTLELALGYLTRMLAAAEASRPAESGLPPASGDD